MRKEGDGMGATTGGPRRCGWFDAVVGKYAVDLNGIEQVALTKVDVLDQLDTIKVCTAYKYQEKELDGLPADPVVLQNCEPVYTEYAGWQAKTSGIQSVDRLPDNAKRYIDGLEKHLGAGFVLISTGPDRADTIRQGDLF